MTPAPADYVIAAVALAAAILGLFGGFSGALAFLAGVAGAAATARFGHGFLAQYIATDWMCLLATGLASLVAFGLARLVVKKTVHGLLAQPGDAVFGALTAGATGGFVALAAAFALRKFGIVAFDSALLDLVGTLV